MDSTTLSRFLRNPFRNPFRSRSASNFALLRAVLCATPQAPSGAICESSIYIYMNLEEGPPFGGKDCAHVPVRLAPILIVLNMVETSMFPWRRSWFVFPSDLERTRVGRITSGTSALVVVGGFLSCFCFTPFSCFRGARRSVMTFCCVFVASRKFARPY